LKDKEMIVLKALKYPCAVTGNNSQLPIVIAVL